MAKDLELESVYLIQWPDGKLWGDGAYTSHERAQLGFVGFFMHHAAQPFLTKWDAEYYWKAYEQAGFKIIRRELQND